jgi:hypothetical protein
MYQVVKPKPGCPPLPEVCIGLITSFQDQQDKFFLCQQPERYFWEYQETEEDNRKWDINLMKNLRRLYCSVRTGTISNFTDKHLAMLLNLQILHCGRSNERQFPIYR